MAGLKVFKELQLPQETEINSIYLVSSEQSETVDIFITGNQSGTIKRIRNASDIESIIDQKLLNYDDAINSMLPRLKNDNIDKYSAYKSYLYGHVIMNFLNRIICMKI